MRHFLVIDDIDQSAEIAEIETKLKNDGIDAVGHWFDPTCDDCSIKEGDGPDTKYFIDLEKVKAKLEELYNHVPLDFVFSDFKLEDDRTNGLQLIVHIKKEWNKIKKKSVIMYSSDDDQLAEILRKELDQEFPSFNHKYNEIVKHFKGLPQEILNRGHYKDKVVELFKTIKYDMDSMLLNKLDDYKNEQFDGMYPPFQNKKLKEVVSIVGKYGGPSQRFRLELIERIVADCVNLGE